ncbi:MAG: Gfo/Idh/MocA family oxidoreductase [Planctomycetaceae bacterium]|jgi:predicted dehydrogenase|nr:Gfo/Idh/MocA family oxidoreductase [Planctomycetaceae bacterium]
MTPINSGDFNRRGFLKGGVLAAAVPAAGLGAFYFSYGKSEGNPIRVAILGTGDEGSVLLGAINPDYIQVKAIADIRPYNQYRAFHGDNESPAAQKVRAGLMAKYGWKTEYEARKHVKVYADYRDLLEKEKEIEAVIIGLPLHLHAPAAIMAMRRGLHVLTEKLMGHSVANCKEMARTAETCHKHLATGHQRHYNILYHDAVETIKRGILGEVHYIRAQWHRGNRVGSDSWQMPMPSEIKPDDNQAKKLVGELANLKKTLDSARGRDIEPLLKKIAQKEAQIQDAVLTSGGSYNGTNVKSAKDYGYLDTVIGGEYSRPAGEELLRWRLFDRTGGGLMVELGSHQLDAASIFLTAQYQQQTGKTDKIHPLSVLVSMNRNIFGIDREVADHVTAIVEFPAHDYDPKSKVGRKRKICVQYSTINGNGFGGYGEIVYGTKGTLILAKEAESQILKSGGSATKVTSEVAALDTQASGPAQKAVAASGGGPEVSRGYKEELEHWAWCIRVNPKNQNKELQPRCTPKIAMGDAIIALVTNIAPSLGGKVAFKEEWFDPDSDETPEGTKPDLSKYDA